VNWRRGRDALEQLREVGQEWWVRIALALVCVLVVGVVSGFRVNVSPSLPLGLYRTGGDATTVERGSVVIVCLPPEWARFALQRGILGPGRCRGGSFGLGKIVLAVGGDVVAFDEDGVTVNGEYVPNSRPPSADQHGRRIPHHPWGKYTLRAAEIWLFSPYQRAAFDSRYFGVISVSSVTSVVHPVWTAKYTPEAALRNVVAQ
jgi:conjugative transfer signal peptidase TraF